MDNNGASTNPLKNLNIEEICMNKEILWKLVFPDLIKPLTLIRDTIVELEDLNYEENLINREINEVNHIKNKFNELIGLIKQFNIYTDNSENNRNWVHEQVHRLHDEVMEKLRLPLTFLRQNILLKTNSREDVNEILRKAEHSEELYNQKIKELDQKLESLNEQKSKVEAWEGILSTKYLSKEFDEQSKSYGEESKSWLSKYRISYWIILIIVSLNFGWYIVLKVLEIFKKLPDNLNINDFFSIHYWVVVLSLISIIFYWLRFSSKNYNNLKNLSVINRHRRNVAETFTKFLETKPEEKETRDVLLSEASKAMFSHKASWYLDKEPIQINSPIQELVTKVLPK